MQTRTSVTWRDVALADHEWLEAHRADLERRHPDCYVAVHQEQVVAVAQTIAEILSLLAPRNLSDSALISYLEPAGAVMGF